MIRVYRHQEIMKVNNSAKPSTLQNEGIPKENVYTR